MWTKFQRLAAAAALGICLAEWASAQLREDFAPDAAEDGVLLLRNGRVIEGKISREGNEYLVVQPDMRLRLRATEVEHVCRNLEEGYRRKQAEIQPGNGHGHLQLAQWCLQHNLLSCAASELSAAGETDPSHPMLAILQRRLKTAMQPPESTPPPTRSAGNQPSADDLDRLVRGMPPGAVEAFAQSVQPLLMNHCMGSGCHGPQPQAKLEFMRIAPGQSASRRLTQRNLHAALEWVNRDDPAASRLLTAPKGPHGTAKAPIFTEHQVVQYQRIMEWVYKVSGQPVPSDVRAALARHGEPGGVLEEDPWAKPLTASKPAHVRPLPRPARETPASRVRRASAQEPAEPDAGPNEEQLQPIRSKRPASAPAPSKNPPSKPGASPKQPAGGDPFDPEVFNRQFLEERRAEPRSG